MTVAHRRETTHIKGPNNFCMTTTWPQRESRERMNSITRLSMRISYSFRADGVMLRFQGLRTRLCSLRSCMPIRGGSLYLRVKPSQSEGIGLRYVVNTSHLSRRHVLGPLGAPVAPMRMSMSDGSRMDISFGPDDTASENCLAVSVG